jgi:hypothetical protein
MPTKKSKLWRSWDHYTVMLAFVITAITVFLLGMFLTETLWNGGLNYFSDIAREGQVRRAKISILRQYADQFRAQEAQAATLSVPGLKPYQIQPSASAYCFAVSTCRNTCLVSYATTARKCDVLNASDAQSTCYTKGYATMDACLHAAIVH